MSRVHAVVVAVVLCAAPAAEAAAAGPADHVLTGGQVYTMDPAQPWVQALAIDGGRIVYAGSDAGARRFAGRGTRSIDLRGRMAMPGLQDSHSHAIAGGASLLACSLDYLALTEAQFRRRIQACLDRERDEEPDAWLEVSNWAAEETEPKGTVLTKAALDGLDTERPVIVSNVDGHKALVNARGLIEAGITAATPDPPGGVIGREPTGEPNGLLFEAAQDLARDLIPAPTLADRVEWAGRAVASLNAAGVTSIYEPTGGVAALRAYRTLLRQKRLTLRVQVGTEAGAEDARDLPALLERLRALRRAYRHPRLRPGAVKVFADGVLEHPAKTAAVLRPYLRDGRPTGERGLLLVKRRPLARLATALNAARWAVHVHAIGDRAVRTALDAFAASRRANGFDGWGPRNAITHLQLIHPSDIPRFARLKVIPNMQMQWFQRDGFTVQAVRPYVGLERFRRLYPAGSLLRAGARLAASSDWPVDPLFPWYAIERAVTRRAEAWYGDPRRPLDPAERISLADALRAYTASSAFQLRQARRTGSLEVGKLADLIVLDRNLFRIPARRIAGTKVLLTMVGGRVVSRQGAATAARTVP